MMGSHALHGFAWAAVRLLQPHEALRATRLAARVLPPLDAAEAATTARRLRGGTCLTRSIAVAARVRGASVTIGGAKEDGVFSGHAWVELEGQPLSGQTVSKAVLVRLT